jgi:FMN phosphatase YigB (HAD superfamily)
VPHPASACLFVDDRKDNCTAAASVGMAVHHFTDAPSLRAALTAAGVP